MHQAGIAVVLALAGPGEAAQRQPIVVTSGWARATLPGQPVGAAYLTIVNRGTAADRLVAARSPRARAVTLHSSAMRGGVMRMRPLTAGLTVGAGQRLRLAPGALHLMLDGLGSPLRPGQRVPLMLRFARSGEIAVSLVVMPAGATPPEHAHAR